MNTPRCLAFVAFNASLLTALMLLPGCATPRAANTPLAAEDSDATVERELTELTRKWLAAMESRDVATVEKLLSDDFVQMSFQGPRDSKSNVLAFLAGTKAPDTETLGTHDILVRPANFPVVTYRSIFRSKNHSYFAGQDPKHSPVIMEVFSSVQFRSGSSHELETGYPAWRIISAHHMPLQQMSPQDWARQNNNKGAVPTARQRD